MSEGLEELFFGDETLKDAFWKLCEKAAKYGFSLNVETEPVIMPQQPSGAPWEHALGVMKARITVINEKGTDSEGRPLRLANVFVGHGATTYRKKGAPDFDRMVMDAEDKAVTTASGRALCAILYVKYKL